MYKDERDETKNKINYLTEPIKSLNNINDKYVEIDKKIKEFHKKLNKHFSELLDLLKCIEDLKDFTVKVDKKVENLDDIAEYNSSIVNKIYNNIKEKLSTVEKQFEYN